PAYGRVDGPAGLTGGQQRHLDRFGEQRADPGLRLGPGVDHADLTVGAEAAAGLVDRPQNAIHGRLGGGQRGSPGHHHPDSGAESPVVDRGCHLEPPETATVVPDVVGLTVVVGEVVGEVAVVVLEAPDVAAAGALPVEIVEATAP